MKRSPQALEAKAIEAKTRKAIAWEALLNGETKKAISERLGYKQSELIKWEIELKAHMQHGTLTEAYLEKRKEMLPKVLQYGMNLIANAFKAKLDSGEDINLREAELVSRIVSNVDTIARLDAGDATEIVDIKRTIPTTFKDIVAAFKKDPFIDTQLLINEIEHKPESMQTTGECHDTRDETEVREDTPAAKG